MGVVMRWRDIGCVIGLLLGSGWNSSMAMAQQWSRSWAAAPQGVFEGKDSEAVPAADVSYRQVVLLSDGGAALRVRLTNELSETALHIGSASVAIVEGTQGCIIAGTRVPLTFSGKNDAWIPAHALLLSDPVALKVAPASRIAVTMYFPAGAKGATQHARGWTTGRFAEGDQSSAACMPDGPADQRRIALSGVDVENGRPHRTVVTLGDSITDGSTTTVDANRRWPDRLAERLRQAGMKDVAIANQGISGNRVLKDGNGPGALARLDRDVLSVPGISHVIVLEGVNDIGNAARNSEPLTAGDMIQAYRQIIARSHARHIKVVLATILPFKGAGYWNERAEAIRHDVNQWILSNRDADGAIDFAKAVRDPADINRLAPMYDAGDALHPNDAGMAALAHAVDLGLLK